MEGGGGYLWFFVALASGAAATVGIKNLGTLIKNRKEVSLYPTLALWNLFLLLLLVEMWVASPLATNVSSSIQTEDFLFFIVLPIGVALMAYLLSTEETPVPEDGSGKWVNYSSERVRLLSSEFQRNRHYFFGIMIVLVLFSFIRQALVQDSILLNADAVYRLLIIVGAGVGMVIRGPKSSAVLAGTMCVLIVAYTLTVFPYVSPA